MNGKDFHISCFLSFVFSIEIIWKILISFKTTTKAVGSFKLTQVVDKKHIYF